MRDAPAGPVAYCAPGRKTDAALTLTLNGQAVTEIAEHPWLTGTEVFVVHPEAFTPLREEMPWAEPVTPRSPEWWRETLLRNVREFASAADEPRSPGWIHLVT